MNNTSAGDVVVWQCGAVVTGLCPGPHIPELMGIISPYRSILLKGKLMRLVQQLSQLGHDGRDKVSAQGRVRIMVYIAIILLVSHERSNNPYIWTVFRKSTKPGISSYTPCADRDVLPPLRRVPLHRERLLGLCGNVLATLRYRGLALDRTMFRLARLSRAQNTFLHMGQHTQRKVRASCVYCTLCFSIDGLRKSSFQWSTVIRAT